MSEIGSIGTLPGGIGTGPVGGDDLGQDQFLQLLVTQLKHQDPLSPVSNADFLAQLAQFTSVEQLRNINSGTQTGLLLQQSITNSLATSLIGKDVLVGTSDVTITGGEEVEFCFSLGGEGRATAEIYDKQGTLVRTIIIENEDDLPLAEGEHNFTWDGLDEYGEPVEDGSYRVEVSAEDEDGLPVSVRSYLRGRVEGIRFAAGNAYIVIGEMEFTLADIVEVREPIQTEPTLAGEATLRAG